MAMIEGQLCDTSNLSFPMIRLERRRALDVFIDFMLKNQPCRIYTKATAKWKSRRQWVKHVNGKSAINVEFFIKKYGHMEVPLVKERIDKIMENREKCMDYEEKSSSSCSLNFMKCQKMKLKDYIEIMRKNNGSNNIGYVKDWHFQQESGTSYEMYGLPSVLRFDWINNELWSNDERNQLGDYRFVYFGAKNTWTPFHADVMSSYSWSANICGRKLWYFVPPNREECFRIDRDTFLEDIRTVQDKWPKATVISFIQEEGEIVFVPSNWYHQVHNLEDTVSINHNFVNASNVDLIVELIIKRLMDIDRELADCRSCFSSEEYNSYCEKILAADIRVNLAQLSSLLQLIIKDRGNEVNECWVCPRHRSFPECKKDGNCLEFMRTAIRTSCSCQMESSEICNNCLNFMKQYEISIAAECLARIHYIEKERN
ncbi:jmjC domain-containing protein [Loa loa]|uniref:Jumonji domain-containing protein 4 n=1 Tax=Loa loa TaxID=7209 RepID=A0A1S0TYE2_LOALO|nr:jmjC domain-containing protein [Loa loa]EFO21548.2 jmjC domain-containing protein [Loa loa]